MNQGFFPRSKSFDPSYLSPISRPHSQHTSGRQNVAGFDNALFGLSSLELQETPWREMRQENIGADVSCHDVSMMSPMSDRSVEPMVVSDVSNGDLDDTDSLRPIGGSQTIAQSVVDDDYDMQSVASGKTSKRDGTEWLWSLKMKSSEPDVDTQSAVTDATSCVSDFSGVRSFATVRSHDSEQFLTQRKTPFSSAKSMSIPDMMFEKEYHPNNNNSHVKPCPVWETPKRKSLCRKCLTLINGIFVVAILFCLLLMGSKNMQDALCAQKLEYNIAALEANLQNNVFGQHLALRLVLDHVSELISSSDKNVSVLSFHGWTGIGKNFVSAFVAKRVGDDSVHKIIVPLEFAHGNDGPHDVAMFTKITSNLPSCGLTVFVVDEIDKASVEAMKGLHRALEHLKNMQKPNVKVLVLLLSNSGGSAINRYTLDQLTSGQTRDSIRSHEVVNFMLKIDNALISHEWYVPMLEDDLIDAIVPFLPLEKSHVGLCVRRYITETRPMLGTPDVDQIVEQVLQQMTFFPQNLELFSSTGCRGVALKVDLTID